MPPQILQLKYDPDSSFIELQFPRNERFNHFVRYGIRPTAYRRWNGRCWEIHRNRLFVAVSMGKKYFDQVDWSSLPEGLQIALVRFLEKHNRPGAVSLVEEPQDPHEVLFVLPEAPWEVIQAAYKALALLQHPDRPGGTKEQFQRLSAAYETLRQIHERQTPKT